MAQKSLFNKFVGLFSKKNKQLGGSTLSASAARHVQRNYISADNTDDLLPLPPYLEIAKQLYSPKTEVFSAALYYLQKIAVNEPDEAAGIVKALNDCLKSKNKTITPQHREQIAQAAADIATASAK